MLIFKSMEDIRKARLPSRLRQLVQRCVETTIRACDFSEAGHPYDPDEDGYVVLLQQGDDTRPLEELHLSQPVAELVFESLGVDVKARAFVGFFLANNQFGLTIIQPDATWLDPAVRARLVQRAKECAEEEEA